MRIFSINYTVNNNYNGIKTFKNSQPLRGEVVEVTTTSTETNVKENNSKEQTKEKNTDISIVKPKKKDKKEFFLKRWFKKINIFSKNDKKKEKV